MAGGVHQTERDGNRRRAAGARERGRLRREEVSEVPKRIGPGKEPQPQQANVDDAEMNTHGDDRRKHEESDIGKGFAQIVLLPNGQRNQRQDGKGCQQNDPIN